MRLDFLMLADAAQVQEGGKLFIMGGGITRITPPELPFVLARISTVARFAVDEDDWDQPHDISFRWLAPSGKQLGPTATGRITVGGERPYEGEEHALVLVADTAGLELAEEGRYTLEASLDGESVDRRVVVVAVAPAGSDMTAA